MIQKTNYFKVRFYAFLIVKTTISELDNLEQKLKCEKDIDDLYIKDV